MFHHVDAYAGDPVLTLFEAYQRDPRPNKVSLSIGIYQDDAGRVPLLDLVRRIEVTLAGEGLTRAYLAMEGMPSYREHVQRLIFGADCAALQARRIVTIQTIGGSGALKVGADFLQRYFPNAGVWVSDPTWDNHRAIFEGAGFVVGDYPYYDANTGAVRFTEMLAKISSLPQHSVVVLQPCCHNPTGMDLARAQWRQLVPVLVQKRLIPFLDIAYQGFGEGIEDDAWEVRELAASGASFLLANSFSKNLALYGERCGGLSVVCPDEEQALGVLGQLKFAVRRNYSSPPTHGAQLVTRLLADAQLSAEWYAEVARMRERMQAMRRQLHDVISARIAGRDFSYLIKQRGMFSYTGLSPQQVDALRERHAVYLVRSGRLCVAGLNTANVDYVAQSMAAVM